MLLVLAMALSLSACHKHSWEPATCDKPKTCSECGKTEGDPLGHKWGEPVYEWAEDMSSVTALRICENDPAHVESETVETSAEETRSATCTEAGETTFTAQFENSVFAPQSRTEALPEALGHAWGEPEYEWAEDMSSVVATRVCEHDPAHAMTRPTLRPRSPRPSRRSRRPRTAPRRASASIPRPSGTRPSKRRTVQWRMSRPTAISGKRLSSSGPTI